MVKFLLTWVDNVLGSSTTLGLHHLVLGKHSGKVSDELCRRLIAKDNPFTFSTHPRDLISFKGNDRDLDDPMNNMFKIRFQIRNQPKSSLQAQSTGS